MQTIHKMHMRRANFMLNMHQILFLLIAGSALLGPLVPVNGYTEYCSDRKEYKSPTSCPIKSGDYSGSELSNVINGGNSKIKLTVAALETETDDILPTLKKIALGVNLVPKVGSIISGVFNFMVSIFGDSSNDEASKLNRIVQDILNEVEREITDLYNYIDEVASNVIKGDLKGKLKTVSDSALICKKQSDDDSNTYTEDDIIQCLEAIEVECYSGNAGFTTHHDDIINYELTFPLMRDYGHMCSSVYTDLLGIYQSKNEMSKLRLKASRFATMLNNFITLYDDKLDLIVAKHTSDEHRNANLNCCLTKESLRLAALFVPYWRTIAFKASCTAYFGHRSVALQQEKCQVTYYFGCDATPEATTLTGCWNGDTFEQIDCAKANSLYKAMMTIEDYWNQYKTNRGAKLRTYWQKTVGDVVDKWRDDKQELDTIIATLEMLEI